MTAFYTVSCLKSCLEDILDKTQPNKDKSVTQEQIQDTTDNTQQVCVDKARTIKQLGEKRKGIPIPVDEEGNPKDSRPEPHEPTTGTETNENSVGDTAPNEHLHSSRNSGRPKRPPVTRHDDFLWSTSATKTKQ